MLVRGSLMMKQNQLHECACTCTCTCMCVYACVSELQYNEEICHVPHIIIMPCVLGPANYMYYMYTTCRRHVDSMGKEPEIKMFNNT